MHQYRSSNAMGQLVRPGQLLLCVHDYCYLVKRERQSWIQNMSTALSGVNYHIRSRKFSWENIWAKSKMFARTVIFTKIFLRFVLDPHAPPRKNLSGRRMWVWV